MAIRFPCSGAATHDQAGWNLVCEKTCQTTVAGPAMPKPRCFQEPHLQDAGRRSKDMNAGSFRCLELHLGDQNYLASFCRCPLL